MTSKNDLPEPKLLPHDGCSRWSQFAEFSPVGREKFRQLSIEGKAPTPIRIGIRCTFYQNRELHKFLADPLTYEAGKTTHPQAIYESISDEVKRQFEFDVVLWVNRLIEGIESNLPLLTNQEKAFFTAIGNASKDGNYGAVYEAFGKVLTE